MSKIIPTTLRQILVKKLSTNFREATEIVEKPIRALTGNEILIRQDYVGINASDVNFSAGRYDPTVKPPFEIGFEGIGQVVSAASDSIIKEGQYVSYLSSGAFADYKIMPSNVVIPVSSSDPAYLAFLVSGLTASIALEKEADLKQGKKVLITAAAGGTGQFAVQLAKLAGCHVIGTCSSEEKASFLKSIGCDRAVNYRTENLHQVLKKEYPNGVDVVYECVGKDMMDASIKNIAQFGRIIVIGSISGYVGEGDNVENIKDESTVSIPMSLLAQCASMRGFFLTAYFNDIPAHVQKLSKLYQEGKLKVSTDNGENYSTGPFIGLDKVADAVEYLYSRKSIGKIVVQLPTQGKSLL